MWGLHNDSGEGVNFVIAECMKVISARTIVLRKSFHCILLNRPYRGKCSNIISTSLWLHTRNICSVWTLTSYRIYSLRKFNNIHYAKQLKVLVSVVKLSQNFPWLYRKNDRKKRTKIYNSFSLFWVITIIFSEGHFRRSSFILITFSHFLQNFLQCRKKIIL